MKHLSNISVVGAGLMGHGIAQAFAQKKYNVTLYDLSDRILEQALNHIASDLETFVEEDILEKQDIADILSRINLTTDLRHAASGADLIIEAAPEDLDLKKDLFTEMDRYAPDHTILASNTSMLPISRFGSQVSRKEKLIITHWFNPPAIVPVVEIVQGNETSEATVQTTFQLLKDIGKQPVRVRKEIPGFLVNRIQTAMFREVLSLLEQEVASPEDIDTAVKGSFGLRLGVIGVLETMDMAGLDLMYKGTRHLYQYIDHSTEPQRVLEEKVEQGALGVKTGKGFFSYETGDTSEGTVSKVRERDHNLLKILKALGQI